MRALIKKVARAIYEARIGRIGNFCLDWEALPDRTRTNYKDEAKAAIEAMRVPTNEMTKAAIGYGIPLSDMYEGSEEDFVEDVYQEMIDKALEEV